ncbi:Uma2 family endonuclease [Salinifilum ghardaiensis]
MTALIQHELGPFTIADWHALAAREDGSRLELIEGYWLVTPPPTGQHQWAADELVHACKTAFRAAQHSDLHPVSGIGVEFAVPGRTALVPDLAVLNTRPIGPSFAPRAVLLFGEIWSPANTASEQRDKFTTCESAGIPYFWSLTQDSGGVTELTTYRLDGGRYRAADTASRGDGPVPLTAAPVPVAVDVAALRP